LDSSPEPSVSESAATPSTVKRLRTYARFAGAVSHTVTREAIPGTGGRWPQEARCRSVPAQSRRPLPGSSSAIAPPGWDGLGRSGSRTNVSGGGSSSKKSPQRLSSRRNPNTASKRLMALLRFRRFYVCETGALDRSPATSDEVRDAARDQNENRQREKPGPPAVSCDQHINLRCLGFGPSRSGRCSPVCTSSACTTCSVTLILGASFGLARRRGWDLNPRTALRRSAVFKTAPFGRSGTPP
jgi:hypothetical protein